MRIKDIRPGSTGTLPRFLTNVNGTLFFSADDGTHGYELWKSDGTADGTVLVKDGAAAVVDTLFGEGGVDRFIRDPLVDLIDAVIGEIVLDC